MRSRLAACFDRLAWACSNLATRCFQLATQLEPLPESDHLTADVILANISRYEPTAQERAIAELLAVHQGQFGFMGYSLPASACRDGAPTAVVYRWCVEEA